MMRFLISIEVKITDPVAARAAGVSSVKNSEGRPVDLYIPDGEFGPPRAFRTGDLLRSSSRR